MSRLLTKLPFQLIHDPPYSYIVWLEDIEKEGKGQGRLATQEERILWEQYQALMKSFDSLLGGEQ